MLVPKTSHLSFWRAARVVLAIAFAAVVFSKLLLSPGFLRSYAFDVMAPAWAYVEFRGLYAPSRSNWRTRLIGCSPERTALVLFVATAAAEGGQYFNTWTHLPGVFDMYDLIAYAVGIGACYGVDKVLARSR
jgi:hypothetical protein